MWRVVASNLCAGLHELEERWSLDDLVQAHQTLDVLSALEAAANKPPKTKR